MSTMRAANAHLRGVVLKWARHGVGDTVSCTRVAARVSGEDKFTII